MKLLTQPEDGIQPVIEAIQAARTSIEIVIFRCDQAEVEKALAQAKERGVHVHALITYTNRGGEKNLRKLELRLLAAGVTVTRTADDLTRYHGKMMIVDRAELHVHAFNLTRLDMGHSRSFGVVTRNRKLAQEACKLFEADAKRLPYSPGSPSFLVSPANSRKELAAFIKGARKELLIYDPDISDPAMIRLLDERAAAGVDIKILGRLVARNSKLAARKLPRLRLHTRTILRDRKTAFIGSQSLRALELDSRREIGLIFRDSAALSRMVKTFEEDWARTEQSAQAAASEEEESVTKVARKVAKAVTRDMAPVAPIVDGAVRDAGVERVELDAEAIEETVRDAVKEAVKQVVRNAVEEAAGK
ncbi:MAG TPA: phospholipase D-like domain-containing protein [Bryobacteraceae bacterium]|nr:phospholipase D-like domain-containing protein [Bryobacteraceae bacterium]